MSRRALVLGGSGAVGSAVVRALAARGVETRFTYHRLFERAEGLAKETGSRAARVDLTDAASFGAFLRGLSAEGAAPDVLIHCAADSAAVGPIGEVSDGKWDAMMAVGARAAFIAARELGPAMAARGGGDIVLLGALDRAQSLPLPVAFAAVQGAIATTAMALAKELGPRGVRVNVVALGLLDEGIGRRLDRKLVEDYLAFSALRRLGTTAEAARAIVWLALENTYLNGKTIPVNGGL